MNRITLRFLLATLTLGLWFSLATPADAAQRPSNRARATTVSEHGLFGRLWHLFEVLFMDEGIGLDPNGLKRPLPPNSEA